MFDLADVITENNLPAQMTRLVGRETELGYINEVLGVAPTRLLTLVGPGGVGKTRLALQAAIELGNQFRQGVFFVPLNTVQEPRQLLIKIARCFNLRSSLQTGLLESLLTYLHDRQILLVLDNLEHILRASHLITKLLENTSGLKVLVTSSSSSGFAD